MSASVVGVVKCETTAAGATATFTLPASGIVNGDIISIAVGGASGLATVSTSNTGTASAVMGLRGAVATFSGHTSQVYEGTLLASDVGKTIVFVLGTATSKPNGVGVILRGTTSFDVAATPFTSAAGSLTCTAPVVASIKQAVVEVSFVFNSTGAGAVTTLWTPPGAVTKQQQSLSTGGSNPMTSAVGTVLTEVTPATNIGNRAWTSDSSGTRSAHTLGYAVAIDRNLTDIIGLLDSTSISKTGGGTVTKGGTDTIFSELVAAGYISGSILDRERARLLAKTGASPVGNTLQDLYRIAGERPRL